MSAINPRMIFCWGCDGYWIEGYPARCQCDDPYQACFQDWWVHPPVGWSVPYLMSEEERSAYFRSVVSMPKRYRPIQDVIVRGGLL